MIILKFIFILGIIASCNVLAQEISARMENGRKCDMNEAALLASLAYGPTPFCGGSFIASGWVLTAAHCCVLMELHTRFAIFGGQLTWRQDIEQTVKVGDLFVPEGYSLYPLGGDICVVKLAQPINPSAKVKISKLATTKEFEDLVQSKKCDNALTMGFGHLLYKRRGAGKRQASTTGGTTGAAGTTGSGGTTAGGAAGSVGTGTTVSGATVAGATGTGAATGNMSATDGGTGGTKPPSGGGIQEHARCGTQQLLPREKCHGDPEIGKTITESIICMKDPKGQQQEPCQGDSGGPVYCGDLQIGVISVAIGCRDPKLPGYYTRVDMFKDYIDRVMSMQERSLFAVQEKNTTNGGPGGSAGGTGNATTKSPGGAAAKPSGGNSLGYSKILMFIPVIMRLAIF